MPKEIWTSALSNLIQNAFKHAQARVQVNYREAETGGLEVFIEDDDSGLSDAHLGDLIAGKVVQEPGGHGLGLYIVRACLKVLNGSLSFSRSQMGGLQARVFLPNAPA